MWSFYKVTIQMVFPSSQSIFIHVAHLWKISIEKTHLLLFRNFERKVNYNRWNNTTYKDAWLNFSFYLPLWKFSSLNLDVQCCLPDKQYGSQNKVQEKYKNIKCSADKGWVWKKQMFEQILLLLNVLQISSYYKNITFYKTPF